MLDRIKHAPIKAAAALAAVLVTLTTATGCTGFSPGQADTGAATAATSSAFDSFIAWVTTGQGGLITAGIFVTMFVVWMFRRLIGNRAVQFLIIGIIVAYLAYAYAQSH